MAYLNTTEEIEQEIEKVNKLYKYKAFIYNEKNKGLNYYNDDNYNLNIRLEYIETELNALKNMKNFENINNVTILSLIKEKETYKNNIYNQINPNNISINSYETDLYKIQIEINSYEVYLDNLNKMITRVNRWNEKTGFELECENHKNDYLFNQQQDYIKSL